MLMSPKVFYCVRADFFHHNHIHKRKIDALRHAGIPASLISFVTDDQWQIFKDEYKQALAKYETRVIRIPGPPCVSRTARFIIRGFFAAQLLAHRRILVQFLGSDPQPLFRLRRLPFFRGRLRTVLEYEGDLLAETLYLATVDRPGGPFEEPPDDLLPQYSRILETQALEINNSDALIFASREHFALVSGRMGRQLRGVVFPTLFDPITCKFSPEERTRLRSELGVAGSIVLVHSGGVHYQWHRFPDVCRFVAALLHRGLDVKLLGLIRKTELDEARRHVEEAGIGRNSHLLHVAAEAVPHYLSAADLGLFCRHSHTMTRIVSSAKLGEYLACGLPVLSTGAHAYYNEYMQRTGMQLTIPESLEVPTGFERMLLDTVAMAQDTEWRRLASSRTIEEFYSKHGDSVSYVELCETLLYNKQNALIPVGKGIESLSAKNGAIIESGFEHPA
jgi:glycosyltransferase involved in cell wall biosynthesis